MLCKVFFFFLFPKIKEKNENCIASQVKWNQKLQSTKVVRWWWQADIARNRSITHTKTLCIPNSAYSLRDRKKRGERFTFWCATTNVVIVAKIHIFQWRLRNIHLYLFYAIRTIRINKMCHAHIFLYFILFKIWLYNRFGAFGFWWNNLTFKRNFGHECR